jgi:hypothetical protein
MLANLYLIDSKVQIYNYKFFGETSYSGSFADFLFTRLKNDLIVSKIAEYET